MLRERYGFTQEGLATLLGLRRESLSRIETGAVALTLPVLQRITRIVTLSKAVREHLASVESRGGRVDDAFLSMLAVALRLDKATADEVILASMMSYEQKRREALRSLSGHDGRETREGRMVKSTPALGRDYIAPRSGQFLE